MKLKLLQLSKLKLSLKQKILYIAVVSILLIGTSTGLIIYFNSITQSSKASTLPTEIALFTATLNNTGTTVQVYWVTESELNCDFFTIQRSANGIDYSQLTEIAGAGTSNTQLNYTYNDMHPLTGISYYRLKYTDIGGEYHYGAIQSVNNEFTPPANNINVYPIPASNCVYVDVNAYSLSTSQIVVVSITGKISKSITVDLKEGKNKIKIDINDLPNGIYFVNLQDPSGNKISQKMIKAL